MVFIYACIAYTYIQRAALIRMAPEAMDVHDNLALPFRFLYAHLLVCACVCMCVCQEYMDICMHAFIIVHTHTERTLTLIRWARK
jgi:hypothetical protein